MMDHSEWYGGMDVDVPPLDEVIPRTEFIDQDWLEINHETIRTEAFIDQIRQFFRDEENFNEKIENFLTVCIAYLNKLYRKCPRDRNVVVLSPGDSPSRLVLFMNLVFQTGETEYTFPKWKNGVYRYQRTMKNLKFIMFPVSIRNGDEGDYECIERIQREIMSSQDQCLRILRQYVKYFTRIVRSHRVNLDTDYFVYFDFMSEQRRTFKFLEFVLNGMASDGFHFGTVFNLKLGIDPEYIYEYDFAEEVNRRCVRKFTRGMLGTPRDRTPGNDVTGCNLFLLYAYYVYHDLI